MSTEIGLFEAMFSQRAIRSFKPDPIPDDVLDHILTAATKAPSGGNSQPWAFVVVRDPAVRSELGACATERFAAMYEGALARAEPGDPQPFPRLKPMVDAIDVIPVWVVVCAVLPEGAPENMSAMLGGSIFPAVQNLLLAARGHGIGSVLTGLLSGPRPKEILGLPDRVEPMAFIPLGYPDKEHFGPTTRRPISEVVHHDRWEGFRENTAQLAHR